MNLFNTIRPVQLSSEQTANGCRIMAFNSPGGSTLQWGVKQGVLCATLLVWFTTAVSMKRVVTVAKYTGGIAALYRQTHTL